MDAHAMDCTIVGAAAPLAPTGAAARPATPLPANLSSPSAATAGGLVPSGLGLPGYPASLDALTGLLSLTHFPRKPPPGFSTTRPLVVDATWTSVVPQSYRTVGASTAWLDSVHNSIFLLFRNDSVAIVYQIGDSLILRRRSCDSNSSDSFDRRRRGGEARSPP
ncbi:hypothetical protein ZEAMMB73_Zm00001d038249 [Zea mays]|uniref:Uncharacterized protein n=1 Tax=Zea mays TaxID=4577 RepID=A0A1D6M4S5_MAIZE|nr:hypothetical protein ZEAMMB73_Zm00001d038249 [Zea mays]